MNLEKRAEKTVEKFNMLSCGDEIVIGLSGGADSVALLHILYNLKDKYRLKLHAAHINHMIRGKEAVRDAEFAKSTAENLGIEFHLLECDIPSLSKEKGISEEVAGRQVRYDFFNRIAPKIAVAHHKSDSVETTLINLIRGSSLKGLKGISPVNGNIIRPLIECDRSGIEEYLSCKGISFVNDSTNKENIYTRNIVRNVIIPKMSEINSGVISTIFENSRIMSDDDEYMRSVCTGYAEKCIYKENDCIILDFSNYSHLHIAIKRRLVMLACENLTGDLRGVSSVHTENILNLPTGGKTSFGTTYVTRSYNRFIFSKSVKESKNFSYNIKVPCTLTVPETEKSYKFEVIDSVGQINYEKGSIYLDFDLLGNLSIRRRTDGDVFSPLGLNGRKKIKDFLIDCKIPVQHRDLLPILESDNKIAAILCLRSDNAYKITPGTQRILKISEVL